MNPSKPELNKEAIVTAYKLANTLLGSRLEQLIHQPWPFRVQNLNSEVVRDWAIKDFYRGFEHALKYNTHPECVTLLDTVCLQNGIKVLAKERKGQIKEISIQQYLALRELVYQCHAMNRLGQLDRHGMHAFSEWICRLSDFLMLRDTLINGTGMHKLDSVIENLLKNKSVLFFKSGYLKDLFIEDRIQASQAKEPSHIVVNADYLSTSFHSGLMPPDHHNGYMAFQVT